MSVIILKDDQDPAGAISGTTRVATFNSQALTPKDDSFMLSIQTNTAVVGTMTPSIEFSFDGGITWFPYPDDFNSEAQAVMAAITTVDLFAKSWKNLLPQIGQYADPRGLKPQKPVIRFVFTLATTPSFPITDIFYSEKLFSDD